VSKRIDEGGLDLCDSIVVTIFCVLASCLIGVGCRQPSIWRHCLPAMSELCLGRS